MDELKGTRALVTGVANKRSIAFGIAEELAARGARLAVAFQPTGREGEDDKLRKLLEDVKPELLLPLDVAQPDSVADLFTRLQQEWGQLHVLVHSIAGAKREELGGRHSDSSLDGFLLAQHISSYSLISLVRAARPLMTPPANAQGASVITLTYIGAERAVNNYNVMGSAKASLEANVRYLAMELGPEAIRVNAISAGPIRTLASAGIKDFLDLLHQAQSLSALKRNITMEEVAYTAAFLASPRASGITGQVIHVDGGYNIFG